MPGSFTTYRILCSTTPELDTEQEIFLAANADFAEQVCMPEWVLFAAATFRPPFQAELNKAAVEANIRMCDFFIQIFGEKSPPAVYKGFVDYALQCTADPAMPMRAATVLFHDSAGASEEMRALRKALDADPQCDVRTYKDGDDLAIQLRQVFQDWYSQVKRPGARVTAQ